MVKKFDIELVRSLLIMGLVGSILVLFWFIFDTIKTYQRISAEIEDYLQKSVNKEIDVFSDLIVDQLLDKRLDAMKELLSLLFHNVIILFGFVSTIVNNNSLIAIFSMIITTGLVVNLFIPLLFGDTIIVLAVILFTLSWLYFDLNSSANKVENQDHV